jgi:CheY-like chemotaxis protein
MPSPPSTVRVLVIDDDHDDASFLNDLLGESKRSRFIVDLAYNQEEAFEQLKHHRYHVVLMDYKLSSNGDTTTGLDLMDRMRTAHYKVPVILVTSHQDFRVQTEALDRGCADFLEKGKITADLLERTCLYAIGLGERQQQTDSGDEPSMAVILREMLETAKQDAVARTEGTAAQQELVSEMKGLRGDFKDHLQTEFQGLEERCGQRGAAVKGEATEVKDEIRKLQRFRWLLDWVDEHRISAVMIFVALVIAVVLSVFLLRALDVEKVHELRGTLSAPEVVLPSP